MDIDVTQQVGLDLILPVASLLPLERRVQWNERIEIPRKVLDSLADGAEPWHRALRARNWPESTSLSPGCPSSVPW